MKKYTLLTLASAAIISMACGNNGGPGPEEEKSVGTSTHIEGDSTVYGLACYGCTDTVLVFLPGRGGDPVVYNILEATKDGRVIGHPTVGDWVAVIVNGTDTTKADMVIDLDQLKGTWVSLVSPILRERIEHDYETAEGQAHEDSLLKELMQPVEMGFSLKQHYTAQAVGRRLAARTSDDSPVILPTPRNYTEWHVINGQLVLTATDPQEQNGVKNAAKKMDNDTADFILMTHDSLRLRFRDGERGYYRKP